MSEKIQIRLVKLTDGVRLLRFSEADTGLCLEKRLETRQPVVRQKARLLREFEALLSREMDAARCP